MLALYAYGLHQYGERDPRTGIFPFNGALKWINVADGNFIFSLSLYLTLISKKYFSIQLLYSPSVQPEAVGLAWARRLKG